MSKGMRIEQKENISDKELIFSPTKVSKVVAVNLETLAFVEMLARRPIYHLLILNEEKDLLNSSNASFYITGILQQIAIFNKEYCLQSQKKYNLKIGKIVSVPPLIKSSLALIWFETPVFLRLPGRSVVTSSMSMLLFAHQRRVCWNDLLLCNTLSQSWVVWESTSKISETTTKVYAGIVRIKTKEKIQPRNFINFTKKIANYNNITKSFKFITKTSQLICEYWRIGWKRIYWRRTNYFNTRFSK
ncbi:hypothetical protein U3516DRAFT_739932 [Neocallimastix sp. 'constans']